MERNPPGLLGGGVPFDGLQGWLGLNRWECLQPARKLFTCGNEHSNQDFREAIRYREPPLGDTLPLVAEHIC